MPTETASHKYLRWIFTLLLTILGVLAVIFVLPKLISFLFPVVVAWIVSLISAPLIRFMQNKLHTRKKFSSTFVLVLIMLVVLGLVFLLGYILVEEILGFVPRIPEYVKVIAGAVDALQEWLGKVVQRIPDAIISSVDEVEAYLSEAVLSFGAKAGSYLTSHLASLALSVPRILVYGIVTILITYFTITEQENLKKSLTAHTPQFVKDFLKQFKSSGKKAVSGYFMTQLRLSWIVAVILFVGFLILKVPYAFLLSLLVAFVDFLPVFGSGTVLLPWALVDLLSKNYWEMAGMLILYGLTQGIKQVLSPKMMGESMGFPPLASVLCLYVGFRIWGIGGMIFAIPVGMMAVEIYKMGVFDPAIGCIKEMAMAIANAVKKPEETDLIHLYDLDAEKAAEEKMANELAEEILRQPRLSEVGEDLLEADYKRHAQEEARSTKKEQELVEKALSEGKIRN